jgi:hypothetical protein
VNGSFYDFVAERYEGTKRVPLASPPDAWSGRAAVAWAERLRAGQHFDPGNQELIRVAEVLDAIYAGQPRSASTFCQEEVKRERDNSPS